MQVDELTLARYRTEAPELMKAVEPSTEAPWIMKKDPATGFCTKLEQGLCGIHKNYGANFLGDACYFYPRATRALGDKLVMTATLSCPEVARLALYAGEGAALEDAEAERLPQNIKDYLPEGIAASDALAIHRAFIEEAEREDATAEQAYLRIASVARSLELIDKKSWPQAVPFYLKHADSRLLPAEENPSDPFNLLHALCGLVVASKKTPSQRLRKTILEMEQALSATIDWDAVQIHLSDESAAAFAKVQQAWEAKYAPIYKETLKRYLQMQLSLALFPFAGAGNTLGERITIIGVRLATIKLALACACSIHGNELPQEVVVRVVQSLSRFMDHLGDAGFSLQIYTETGWVQEARMRGVLEPSASP